MPRAAGGRREGAERPHRYRLAGLTVASGLALPELGAPLPGDCAADVTIDEGRVPASRHGPAPPGQLRWSAAPGQCRLEVAEVARFQVRGGRRIIAQRTGAADPELLRQYLLGSALGALWHQRGRLPLHAGAVAIAQRAWAFVGASGAGKSSLVVALAALAGAGYLCDDVCVIDAVPAAGALAWPGLARLRVSPALCALLGLEALPGLGALDPLGKRALAPPWPRPAGPLPLAGVLVLERAEAAAAPRLARLGAVDALTTLLTHTYRREYLAGAARARHLAQCAALARTVPVFRLTRSWGSERLAADALAIARLLAALAAA